MALVIVFRVIAAAGLGAMVDMAGLCCENLEIAQSGGTEKQSDRRLHVNNFVDNQVTKPVANELSMA